MMKSAKAAKESKSISWRMKMPRDLHARIKAIAEAEHREINAQCILFLERAASEVHASDLKAKQQ